MEVNELLVDAICCANYSQLQGGVDQNVFLAVNIIFKSRCVKQITNVVFLLVI